MLQHQQNMLQDYVRTGTYWAAITENTVRGAESGTGLTVC